MQIVKEGPHNWDDLESRKPLEWLLVYSIEANGGIDDEWLKKGGMQRAEAEKLLKEDPRRREHIRGLLRIGRLFSLQMLFELLRQRATEMLAVVMKPAEIKSLLGTLRMLRTVEQDEQAFAMRQASSMLQLATASTP
ncbi:MAG: hypothetical protein H7A35_03685 [Planctomycetales bacterium]|nr:hypothetical protein [bacterium]UNM09157.1 MAG: hypothetical protein H7A35_03685 [Planctomycetales bacterium]